MCQGINKTSLVLELSWSVLDARLVDLLGGLGERPSDPMKEDSRLELIRHRRMHNRAVPVAFHMRLIALIARLAPGHSADLIHLRVVKSTRVEVEATELIKEGKRVRMRHQIHEGITQVLCGIEIYGQVHKIVPAIEA